MLCTAVLSSKAHMWHEVMNANEVRYIVILVLVLMRIIHLMMMIHKLQNNKYYTPLQKLEIRQQKMMTTMSMMIRQSCRDKIIVPSYPAHVLEESFENA